MRALQPLATPPPQPQLPRRRLVRHPACLPLVLAVPALRRRQHQRRPHPQPLAHRRSVSVLPALQRQPQPPALPQHSASAALARLWQPLQPPPLPRRSVLVAPARQQLQRLQLPPLHLPSVLAVLALLQLRHLQPPAHLPSALAALARRQLQPRQLAGLPLGLPAVAQLRQQLPQHLHSHLEAVRQRLHQRPLQAAPLHLGALAVLAPVRRQRHPPSALAGLPRQALRQPQHPALVALEQLHSHSRLPVGLLSARSQRPQPLLQAAVVSRSVRSRQHRPQLQAAVVGLLLARSQRPRPLSQAAAAGLLSVASSLLQPWRPHSAVRLLLEPRPLPSAPVLRQARPLAGSTRQPRHLALRPHLAPRPQPLLLAPRLLALALRQHRPRHLALRLQRRGARLQWEVPLMAAPAAAVGG